jgi:hypothetical protein
MLSISNVALGNNSNREFVKRFDAKLPALSLKATSFRQVVLLCGIPDFGSGKNLNHRSAHVEDGFRLCRLNKRREGAVIYDQVQEFVLSGSLEYGFSIDHRFLPPTLCHLSS